MRVFAEALGLATARKLCWLRLAREDQRQAEQGPVALISNDSVYNRCVGEFSKVSEGDVLARTAAEDYGETPKGKAAARSF